MSNYVDLDELKSRTYFETATTDDRYIWQETDPLTGDTTVFRQFVIVDCAHRAVDREGDVCGHCGKSFPHTVWDTAGSKTSRKKRDRK